MTTRNDNPTLFLEELWRNGAVPVDLNRYGIGEDRKSFKYQVWLKPSVSLANDAVEYPISLGIYDLFWEAQEQLRLISEATGFLCHKSLFMGDKLRRLDKCVLPFEHSHGTAERVAVLVEMLENWPPEDKE